MAVPTWANILATFGITGSEAKEMQRLNNFGHLYNWCTFNSSHLDGATDVTTVLQTAITNIRAETIHADHRPRLILPRGKYKINDTLDANKVALVAPDGAMFLAESVGASKEAISWDQSDEAQWNPWNGPTAQGLYIVGRDTPVATITYTTDAWGISAGAPGGIFSNIHLRNFDKAIVGGREYAYIQTFNHVWGLNNNYGFYWPSNGGVSGEKVAGFECNFSNNNVGMYFRHNESGGTGIASGGSFQWFNPSIDYNVSKAIDIIGPGSSVSDLNSGVSIYGGHIETQITTSGSNPRITNGSVLKLIGTTIYDDYDNVINTSFYGRTSLIGVHYAIAGTETKGDGSGNYKTFGSTQRYGGTLTVDTGITEAWQCSYQKLLFHGVGYGHIQFYVLVLVLS